MRACTGPFPSRCGQRAWWPRRSAALCRQNGSKTSPCALAFGFNSKSVAVNTCKPLPSVKTCKPLPPQTEHCDPLPFLWNGEVGPLVYVLLVIPFRMLRFQSLEPSIFAYDIFTNLHVVSTPTNACQPEPTESTCKPIQHFSTDTDFNLLVRHFRRVGACTSLRHRRARAP